MTDLMGEIENFLDHGRAFFEKAKAKKVTCGDCRGVFKITDTTELKNQKTGATAHLCVVCKVRWQLRYKVAK